MTGFSEEQVAALKAKLDASVVCKRSQAGRQFSYVEGWHVIAEANRIFGFDSWHRETVEMRQLGEPREVDGKWRVGYMAKVKVEVFAGERAIIREGCGYGSGIDKDVGSAHESALKEAETDAMKRALMTFGNPFGLALYDKDQENVERGAPAARPAQAPPKQSNNILPPGAPPPPTDGDLKTQAEALVAKLRAADTLFKLDTAMEDGRELCKKLPQATYDYIGKLFEKRRTAMERAA